MAATNKDITEEQLQRRLDIRTRHRAVRDPKFCKHHYSYVYMTTRKDCGICSIYMNTRGEMGMERWDDIDIPDGQVFFWCCMCPTEWQGTLAEAPDFVLKADKETR